MLSTELGGQQLGDAALWPPAPQPPPPSPTPLPGLPFLGPWGAEQLVDAKSLLPSAGDARDMELECRQETESWLWVRGRQPSRGQSGARAQAMP